MSQLYFDICNKTVNDLMNGKPEGGVDDANFVLSKLLVETVDMKTFLLSTGKYYEYLAWIKKFKKKNSGIEKVIKNNLELEEQ